MQLTEELVWELFVQSGPVVNVYLPKDRVTSQHQGYGFVEFKSEEDANYVSGNSLALANRSCFVLCTCPIC